MWNCLQLGVEPDQLEGHGVPGEAPEPGLAPGCGEAVLSPLQSASHSPHTGQTAGPGNGSVLAQQDPGWGLSPLPSPRPPTHTGQPEDDSLGTPLLEWVRGSDSGSYSPWNILRTGSWKNRRKVWGSCSAVQLRDSRTHPHLDSSSSPHSAPFHPPHCLLLEQSVCASS